MKLKILYVTGAITWRGGELQLINLFWPLEKKGHNQVILCAKGSIVESYCKEKGLHYYTYVKKGGLDLSAPFKLKKICAKEKIDVIYLNDPDAHTIGYLASKTGLKTPAVLTRKKVLPVRNKFFTLKKYNASFIKYIICVSTAVKELLSEKIKDTSKLIVIHEGIEPPVEDLIPPFDLPKEISSKKFDFLIGYTAALTEEKDHFTFLKVAEVLTKKLNHNIGFIIAGDGNMKEEIFQKIQEMDLQEHVFITGFISNIPSLLKCLDLLLFTSRSEAFSISILEALFLKIPVISTKWKGVHEMIEHGKTGLLSEMGDVDSLVENVLKVLHNAELRKALTENAYQFVQQYNCYAMADKIEKVLFNAIRKK